MATITKEILKQVIEEAKQAKNPYDVRRALFNHCSMSDIVPENLIQIVRNIAGHCYSKTSHQTLEDGTMITYANGGYKGIMIEIDDRLALKVDNGDIITIKDFFKAPGQETDIYDSFRKKSYERKTGTGTWLYGEGSFEDIVKKYRRKRKLLLWDYEHTPIPGRKNDNPIDIHICCTYKTFFEYLSTYPKGMETFFKRKEKRSRESGIELYDLQTLHSSKVKIAFLQSFDEWLLNK